jgi:hypothetical protein
MTTTVVRDSDQNRTGLGRRLAEWLTHIASLRCHDKVICVSSSEIGEEGYGGPRVVEGGLGGGTYLELFE